jgi:hypothetical protein
VNGMLWLDNSQDALEVKIFKAAAHFTGKTGFPAEVALVNPEMLAEESRIAGLVVKPCRAIQKHHILICRDFESGKA